jgi:hypothetical protein
MKRLLFIMLLGFSSISMADLTESCKTYFDKLDSFMKAIPKQQSDMIKQSVELAKQQISSLSADNQAPACKQGMDFLQQAEENLFKK